MIISFLFDDLNYSFDCLFAEGTVPRCQLLITIFAHGIMSARFEDYCSNVCIAEGTITVLSLVFTSLLLFILFSWLTLTPPTTKTAHQLSHYFNPCDSKQHNEQESYETEPIIPFAEFRLNVPHLFGNIFGKSTEWCPILAFLKLAHHDHILTVLNSMESDFRANSSRAQNPSKRKSASYEIVNTY